jgi:hypothetical protein
MRRKGICLELFTPSVVCIAYSAEAVASASLLASVASEAFASDFSASFSAFSLIRWSGQIPTEFHVLCGTWEYTFVHRVSFR